MGRLIGLLAIYKFFKIVIPWLWRVAVFTVKTVVFSLGAWIIAFPKNIKVIAREWTDRAEVAGVPSEYDRVLYYGAGAVALVMILLGWVLSAYLTVWFIGILF